MFNVGVHGESLWTPPVTDSKCIQPVLLRVDAVFEKTLVYIITTMRTSDIANKGYC